MVWIRLIFLLLFSFNLQSNELTEQELQYFNFLDLNNDKFISIEEINNSTNILFQLIDSNQDKKISHDELNKKTIEIFFDMKIAKRFCSKQQKVIKVPNTKVFEIVAPILISRGISRIVSDDLLIAL